MNKRQQRDLASKEEKQRATQVLKEIKESKRNRET